MFQEAGCYEKETGMLLAEGFREAFVPKETSPDFEARLRASQNVDPWTHGFAVVHREEGVVVGMCGFKGPPDADGFVEIAYAIVPSHQGKGYATEAAQALADFAFKTAQVRAVRAHTLPQISASTRVLEKSGFARVQDVIDPDDGPVWRWEKTRSSHT
jgi:RimJ/RimL family protein N-acetyltransferase